MTRLTGSRPDRSALTLKLVVVRGIARHGGIRLPPEGSGMARALAMGDPSCGTAHRRAADRCRVALRGDEWMISNHSRRLVCALNGRRIRTGEEAVMRAGDTLELGLLRFVAVAEPGMHRRSEALDGLDIGRASPRAPDARTLRSDTAEDLMHRLHDEFVAAANDPLQLAGGAERWCADPASAEDAPTLDELCAQAQPYPTVRDILLTREGIDRIIEGIDAFGAWDPGHAPVREDVLRLFAPDGGPDVAAQLPSLTRREHHAVSIDSAMALGAVRPGHDRIER